MKSLNPRAWPPEEHRDWQTPFTEDEIAMMEAAMRADPGPYTPRYSRLIATIRAREVEALERAIKACEALLTGHGSRKGGSDTGDAARRGCIVAIQELMRARKSSGFPEIGTPTP